MSIINENFNNSYTLFYNIVEPEPNIGIGHISDDTDFDNLHILGNITNDNLNAVTRIFFDKLLIENVEYVFYPSTATFVCSYFPEQFITELSFTFTLLTNQDGILCVEPRRLSGHHETFNTLSNTIVSHVFQELNVQLR
jgi:hypothetical protein